MENKELIGIRTKVNNNWENILCPYCYQQNQRSLTTSIRMGLYPITNYTKCDFCQKRIKVTNKTETLKQKMLDKEDMVFILKQRIEAISKAEIINLDCEGNEIK